MSVYFDADTVTVNGKRIDLSVFLAMLDPDKRVLWRFIEHEGTIQAVPYSENQVIWIDQKTEE